MYALETPDNWFEDVGEGQLINGEATIKIDPLFLETVTINDKYPMQVFIQPYGPFTVYVERGADSFKVVQIGTDQLSNGKFGYRIIAKREYYEDRRMRATPVQIDNAMRPDFSESEINSLNDQWGLSD